MSKFWQLLLKFFMSLHLTNLLWVSEYWHFHTTLCSINIVLLRILKKYELHLMFLSINPQYCPHVSSFLAPLNLHGGLDCDSYAQNKKIVHYFPHCLCCSLCNHCTFFTISHMLSSLISSIRDSSYFS